MFYKEKIDNLQRQIWDFQGRLKICEDCGCLIYEDRAIKKILKTPADPFGHNVYYCKGCAPKEIEVSGVEYKKK